MLKGNEKLSCGHTLKFISSGYETGGPGELAHQKPAEMLRQYDEIFRYHPQNPERILEIGVCRGGSLAIWKEWFRDAKIIGVDCNLGQVTGTCRDHYSEMPPGQLELVNMTMPDAGIIAKGPFDIIIDDGSHGIGDVRSTFELLWPSVRNGGLYVIEDWSYLDMMLKDVITDLAAIQVGYWPSEDRPPAGSLGAIHIMRRIIVSEKTKS